jgi:outer membrane biosynthesis protein TonB
VDPQVSVQALVDTFEALRRRGGDSLSFMLALDEGPAPASRRRCGAPLPTGAGGLNSEQVRSVVVSHTGALRACYEIEAQKNPDLRGTVTVAWEIDEAGVVRNARVSSATLANDRLQACIVRQLQSWQFPKSDASTTIAAYPFRFGVANPP